MSQIAAPTFALVAKRVQTRVMWRHWLTLLAKNLIPATLILALLLLATLRGSATFLLPWIGWILWLVGSLAHAWWHRPGAFNALALWDQTTGRREAFASAWWFEQRQETNPAAQAHLATQFTLLPSALHTLPQDLPLRPQRWLALPLLIVLLSSYLGTFTAPHAEVFLIDAAMASKAAAAVQKIALTHGLDPKLTALQESEQRQIEDLKQKLRQTAADLAHAAGQEARNLLTELERRARDAEKLADDLGHHSETWASESLIEALRQQADTADLGDAIAAKSASAAAKAAKELASQLKSPQLSPEANQRLNQTLEHTQQQSAPEDRQRTVGHNVLAAGDAMQQGKPTRAGDEFQKLADKLSDLALREQVRNELQQLAQQLRDSGSSIAAQAQENSAPLQQGSIPQVTQAPQGAPPPQPPLSPPAIGQQNPMQPSPSGQGQSSTQPMLTLQQGQPSQQSNGQPMLSAPIPGTPKPDDTSPITLIQPNEPPAGPNNGSIALAMPGGQDPGKGKTDLNHTATSPQASSQQSIVQAQQNSEGQSTRRSVQGAPRAEASTRSATQTALDAIQAEEAALDEAPLPPARREQVRRYFHELRKRLETQ